MRSDDNQIIISDTSTFRFPGQGVTIGFRGPGAPIVSIGRLNRIPFTGSVTHSSKTCFSFKH
jgi:hypothetical protein